MDKKKGSCCGGSHKDGEQCSAEGGEEAEGACCADGADLEEEEEEEDLINNRYVTMDQVSGGDDGEGACGGGDGDVEDLANGAPAASAVKGGAATGPREMVTKLQRRALTKEGYRLIGSHSAVKLCRWTKNQMRGRGGCYKHSFYGITSYQVNGRPALHIILSAAPTDTTRAIVAPYSAWRRPPAWPAPTSASSAGDTTRTPWGPTGAGRRTSR